MNGMTTTAVVVLAASVGAVIWGVQYRSDHQMAAVATMVFGGATDPTYSLAGWAAGLGALAFLIGIALLIGGLVQAGRAPTRIIAPKQPERWE